MTATTTTTTTAPDLSFDLPPLPTPPAGCGPLRVFVERYERRASRGPDEPVKSHYGSLRQSVLVRIERVMIESLRVRCEADVVTRDESEVMWCEWNPGDESFGPWQKD
jgi:hypothetical protein